MVVSAHPNYKDYQEFMRYLRLESGAFISKVEQFIGSSSNIDKFFNSTNAATYALGMNPQKKLPSTEQ